MTRVAKLPWIWTKPVKILKKARLSQAMPLKKEKLLLANLLVKLKLKSKNAIIWANMQNISKVKQYLFKILQLLWHSNSQLISRNFFYFRLWRQFLNAYSSDLFQELKNVVWLRLISLELSLICLYKDSTFLCLKDTQKYSISRESRLTIHMNSRTDMVLNHAVLISSKK